MGHMNEIYALLWSSSANCFHIEPLADTARNGMRFFRRNGRNDYLLLAYGSLTDMQNQADCLRLVIEERAEVRRLYGDK